MRRGKTAAKPLNQNIAIIGYGAEGACLADYFSKKGANVTVCDISSKRAMKARHNFKLRLGKNYLEKLDQFDLVFRSPGIPLTKQEFTPVRDKLTSGTRYFFDCCPCPIVGITGTKGKGTTASLLFEMLKEGWKKGKIYLGGNIGISPVSFLDKLNKNDLAVLELSSFQLQDLNKSPHIAIVLGITPDHMDWHKDMEEYIRAKENIVKFQSAKDWAVLDFDNEKSAGFAEKTPARKLFVSTEEPVRQGGFLKLGNLVVSIEDKNMIVGEKSGVKLAGRHNLKNILTATAAAAALGVPISSITKVIREFPGLPHRLEFVKESGGVVYVNDSASTNPQTAIAAIKSFNKPTILIAGGSDKNADYKPLAEQIAKKLNVKTTVLMGETGSKIGQAIEQAVKEEEERIKSETARTGRPARKRTNPLEIISAQTYQEAFMVCKMIAQAGDVVLFSPASASFDMFENYQERGEVFKRFVNEMTEG